MTIEVHDEGCGVPAEALARIFERFARADSARTRSAGGVGLGLAIVDAIVKAHGGSATVASTPRGSIFALHLPGFTPAAVPGRANGRSPGAIGPRSGAIASDSLGRGDRRIAPLHSAWMRILIPI